MAGPLIQGLPQFAAALGATVPESYAQRYQVLPPQPMPLATAEGQIKQAPPIPPTPTGFVDPGVVRGVVGGQQGHETSSSPLPPDPKPAQQETPFQGATGEQPMFIGAPQMATGAGRPRSNLVEEQVGIWDRSFANRLNEAATQQSAMNATKAKLDAAAELYQNTADEARIAREERSAIEKQYLQDYDAAVTELANTKVDPGRYGKNLSTGQAIGIGLGAMFGGVLAALQGGPNQFLQMLDRAVDRDIDAQKENAHLAARKPAGIQSSLQMFRQRGMDEDQARIGMKEAKLRQIETELRSIQQNTDSELVKNKVGDALANLDQMKLNLRAQVEATAAAAASRAQAGSSAGMATPKELKPEGLVQMPGKSNMFVEVRDKPLYEKLNERTSALAGAKQTVAEIIADVEAGKHQSIEGRAEIDSKIANLDSNLRTSDKLGTLDAGSIEFLKKMRGDPKALVANTTRAQLNAMVANKERALDKEIRAHGGNVVVRAMRKDQYGRVIPSYQYTGDAYNISEMPKGKEIK